MVDVKRSTPVNRYSYDARNLWLAYGLANFFALCAVALGLGAFVSNDASHDNAFSTLLSIGRHRSLDPLFPPCCHGKLPLPKETMEARMRLLEQEDGVENLVPTEEIEPLCRTCAARAAAAASPNPDRRRSSVFSRFGSAQRMRTLKEKEEKKPGSMRLLESVKSFVRLLRKLAT